MKIVVKLQSNCGKIARFNSVNSEIIGRKFTKFVHDVAGLLPFNLLKAASRLTNQCWLTLSCVLFLIYAV